MNSDPLLTDAPRYYSSEELNHMRIAMRLSLATGCLMLLLKLYAFAITDSSAILSDAAESVVHVLAVSFAAYSFRLSLKPADDRHLYGHDRISFFSAGFEGAMIVIAAVYILYETVHEWLTGLTIRNIDEGTWLLVVATAVNGLLGLYLVRQGKKYSSLVLEANGKHVLTDSWTSFGVVVGLVLTMVTGWLPFDPLLAILVSLNILWTGAKLMRRSIGGLMDEADPAIDTAIREVLDRETAKYQVHYHHLRHRNAGNKLLVEFHLLFPSELPIASAHEQATRIEHEIHRVLPAHAEIISHLEPLEGHDEVHERLLNQRNNFPQS